jgi:hypothetical protein
MPCSSSCAVTIVCGHKLTYCTLWSYSFLFESSGEGPKSRRIAWRKASLAVDSAKNQTSLPSKEGCLSGKSPAVRSHSGVFS